MGQKRVFISLKQIATVVAAALVALTAGVIGYVSEQNAHDALLRETQARLFLEARNLALTSGEALLTEFPELTLAPLVKGILKNRPEILTVVILNHEGLIQGSPDPRAIGTKWHNPQDLQADVAAITLRPGEKLSTSDHIYQIECPVMLDAESPLGEVVLHLDRGFIGDSLKATRQQMFTIAGVLLLVSVLITMVLMSWLFQPLGEVREGLIRIGQGDLDVPMKVKDITEMGMLAETVNQMCLDLKVSHNLAEARELEVKETQREVIITLGQVVESRSTETANHTLRVADMSYELAILAGLTKEHAELIRMASPMHDVGKIGIPDSVLNKPGKLTDDEYAIMQRHPDIGYNILKASERPVFACAATIARQHHEKWNGTGYPHKISGEDISLEARIVGLVDVFDAISSNRVYRKAMPVDLVLKIIEKERGEHFDPRLTDLFLGNLNKFLAISERLQDAVVEDPPAEKATQSASAPSAPKVANV